MKLFSLWFYTLVLLYSSAAIPLLSLLVAISRPFVGRRRAMRLFRHFIGVYGRIVVRVLPFPFIRVRYRDFSAPGERLPFVYICNHRSSSDPFLLSLLPGEGIQVVNKWPFRIPVIGRFARWAGYISIREIPLEEFMTRVRQALGEGYCIGAFPEGTRSASRRMGPFHGAMFRACLEAGATLVPVCIMGNEDKPRKGSLLLHPGVIRIHRLPGIPHAEYRHLTPFALKNRVRGILAAHIRETEGEEAHEAGPPPAQRLPDA